MPPNKLKFRMSDGLGLGAGCGWTSVLKAAKKKLEKNLMAGQAGNRNNSHRNPTSEGVRFRAREALAGIGARGISTRCRPVCRPR